MRIEEILAAASVIPVIEIDDANDAAPLADALVSGGLKVVELTLRTPAAILALAAMKKHAPSLIVGMGTIRAREQVDSSAKAGADFLVSPGATADLLLLLASHALSGLPALPGVATVSEAMTAADVGFRALKFFPAEAAGGIAYVKALAGPLPDIFFCPTGGISAEGAPRYLELPNVACVGGSWIAPRELIRARNWKAIADNARRAQALRKPGVGAGSQ